jgi:hypothetical protein
LHVEAENKHHDDIVAVHDDTVKFNFNHKLAGKILHFELEIIDYQLTVGSTGL